MSLPAIYAIHRQQIADVQAEALRIFGTLTAGPCVAGWFPGPSLPVTLFTALRARITCTGGQRGFAIEYNGIPEGQRVGNAGRNILRSDGFANMDLGIIKNTRINERARAQVWVDLFNLSNSRNFGIPATGITDPAFLDQWLTDGGSRRIRLGARLVF